MSSPDIDESDVQAVIEVVRSGRLACGPKTEEFETLMAEYCGVKHAVAVSSGTAALHLIAEALAFGPGDEVLVPSFTFAASINAILYRRATPVFVEIEPDTMNLSPGDVAAKVTERSRAIMAVDVFGHPVEWDDLSSIAGAHGLKVIDDSCEALGAEYRGKKLGSFGDAAAFAFYPNKQITTGEGGMIVTDDPEIAKLARSLRNQGRNEMGAWLWHERLGYNYRMDEMSAALGVSQMLRLDSIVAKREEVARMYNQRLQEHDWVRTPVVRPHVKTSRFVYVVMLDEKLDRDAVMAFMEGRGIPVRAYFHPAHLQPYIKEMFGFRGGELPVTESAARRTIALPFHGNLTEQQVARVCDVLREAVEA